MGAEFPRILFVLRFWFRVGQERKSSYSQKMSWSHMALNRHRASRTPTHTLLGGQLIVSLLTTTQALGCDSVIAVIPMQLPPGDNSSQRPLLSTRTISGGQRAGGCGVSHKALTPPPCQCFQQCVYDPSTPSSRYPLPRTSIVESLTPLINLLFWCYLQWFYVPS